MPLKYITIPEDVYFKNLITGEPVFVEETGKEFFLSFKQFVLNLLNHESFSENFSKLRTAHAVSDSIKNKTPGQVATLSEDDWSVFVEGMKENFKSLNLSSIALIQLMPFFDAVVNASKDSPVT